MNVVLLNLYHGGHHGQHVLELVRYWSQYLHPGTLHVVVTEAFVQQNPEISAVAATCPRIQLHSVAPFPTPTSLVAWDIRHGLEAQRWAHKLQADHLVFLYLDHAQLSLSTFLRGGTTAYSGIHFRPSFHYHTLGSPARSFRERLGRMRKAMLVRMMLSNPNVHTLFELDEYAVPFIRSLRPSRDVAVHLPEVLAAAPPASPPAFMAQAEPHRRTALLFGALDTRKGLHLVLEAAERLDRVQQEQFCLVLAGKLVEPDLAPRIERLIRESRVQVVFEDRFVEENEIQPMIAAVDLNLVPYVGHIGSSGVLVRAAAAGKPVLATDFGVVGAHVRRYRLGRAVDTWTPEPLTMALRDWLADPSSVPFSPQRARAFAEANTAETFASTFFDRLVLPRADA